MGRHGLRKILTELILFFVTLPYQIEGYPYVAFDGPKRTFSFAKAECRKHRGRLAMPKTKEQNLFLSNALITKSKMQTFWIGIERQGDDWKYLDGSPLSDLTISTNSDGKCVKQTQPMIIGKIQVSALSNSKCDQQIGFVCQFDNLRLFRAAYIKSLGSKSIIGSKEKSVLTPAVIAIIIIMSFSLLVNIIWMIHHFCLRNQEGHVERCESELSKE